MSRCFLNTNVLVFSWLIGCSLGGPVPAEDKEARPAPEQSRSLDQQLLDELDSELLEGLDDLPVTRTPADRDEHLDSLDRKLLDQLGDGEDLGEELSPLMKIGRQMRQVEERIGREDTSRQTQTLQENIIADLAKMIEQVKQQRSGGGSQARQQQPSPNQQAAEKSQNRQNGTPQRSSNDPASESTPRTDTPAKADVKLDETKRMLKEVWGHLPERVRDEMQNASSEQFLSKYERLIELYYQRLAEEHLNRR